MVEFCLMTLNTSPLLGGEWDPRVPIDAAAAAGFSYVGLDTFALEQWRADGHDVTELAEHLQTAGIGCWSLAPLVISDDAAATRMQAVKVGADAARLSCPWVEVHIHAEESDASHRAFDEAVRIVADTGRRVALEFVAWHPVSGIRQARRYLERSGSVAASLVVDPWHYFRGTSTTEDLLELPAEQIGYVQFDDAMQAGAGKTLREQAISERAFPGEGVFDLASWVTIMQGKGFAGTVSVEVLADRWRSAEADQREFAQRALQTSAPYWTD